MSTALQPWAHGPFELLVHAEEHLGNGEDFDRRIALISFDNAIEVAIATYLTLNPIQRGGRSYPRDDVDGWLRNYHAKLEFLEAEIAGRGLSWEVEKSHIVWCHDHRNEQYHGGRKGTPELRDLHIIRRAAIWIFEVLFDVDDAESALTEAIRDRAPPPSPQRNKAFDVAIDRECGIIEVGDQGYYASEILFATDRWAYTDLGGRLAQSLADEESASDQASES